MSRLTLANIARRKRRDARRVRSAATAADMRAIIAAEQKRSTRAAKRQATR